MKKVLERYLFSQHYLVGHEGEPYPDAFETIFSLANLFGIRILKGQQLACKHMISVAAEQLGKDVPESFYRFFPHSVKNMSCDHLLFDQLLQYFCQYWLNDRELAAHPFYEERFARLAFRENTEISNFEILTPEEVEEKLQQAVNGFLSSTRPLRRDQYQVVLAYFKEKNSFPARCACKDTAIQLLIDTRDVRFSDFIHLSDVIRLAEILQYRNNREKTAVGTLSFCRDDGINRRVPIDSAGILRLMRAIKESKRVNPDSMANLTISCWIWSAFSAERNDESLRLFDHIQNRTPEFENYLKNGGKIWVYAADAGLPKNDVFKKALQKVTLLGRDAYHLKLPKRDRKLLAMTLDRKLNETNYDLASCFEKQRLWRGLMCCIHYRPKTEPGIRFVDEIWNGRNISAYSWMEEALAYGDVPGAVDALVQDKGPGALARNFRFLLSRCKTAQDVDYVYNHLETNNLIWVSA